MLQRDPERFEYRLTEKGRDRQPVLLALLAWGDRYTAGSDGAPRETVHDECGHVFQMVPTCSECDGEVHSGNVHNRPAPGATAEQRRRAEALRERRAGERRAAEEARAAWRPAGVESAPWPVR